MEGLLTGIFGTNAQDKTRFEESIAKKSETEGITIFGRTEAGRRFSFLDDTQYPERIQGYCRIASIIDHAYFVYPSKGALTTPDGELAVLIDSFGLLGSIEVLGQNVEAETVRNNFKDLTLAEFPVDLRHEKSSVIDFSTIKVSKSLPSSGTLIYIDRAFNVKGVGLVVLGFVLSGKVKIHDKLRLIPSDGGKVAEVKGIQLNDEDQDSAGRGVRVGLSLKGVELKDFAKTSWLDDSSFPLSSTLRLNFRPCKFYKQTVVDRDLHLQVPGELLVARLSKADAQIEARLASEVPVWKGMKVNFVDLNAKNLRIAGGADVIL